MTLVLQWLRNKSGEGEILHFIWHLMRAFEHNVWFSYWCSKWKSRDPLTDATSPPDSIMANYLTQFTKLMILFHFEFKNTKSVSKNISVHILMSHINDFQLHHISLSQHEVFTTWSLILFVDQNWDIFWKLVLDVNRSRARHYILFRQTFFPL